MHALLISPQFPDTFWSFTHALTFIRRKSSHPPLGLLTVAAMLPAAWEKRLVDLNLAPLTDADLAWADCAFIGGMVVQKSSARTTIERCIAAGVRVVCGGPLFTSEPEQFPDVDHLVLNEAELTLPPFLADLENGCAQRLYTSDAYADLHTTPIPAWELADLSRYGSVSLQYCRGCPYDCDFCNITALFGHRPRTKTIAQVIAELDRLYALGWRQHVLFVDDNLIGNKRDAKSLLLPALIDWQRGGRRIPFVSQVSMNLADDADLLQMMSRAGFDAVFIGIETASDDALAECNKKMNRNRDLVADVKRIQRAGIEVQAGFIVGFDSDTPATVRRQIEFIQQSGIAAAMVGLLQAPVGTRLHARMQEAGRLLGSMTGDNMDGTTNILPHMGLDALREQYRAILDHIYSPKHYYSRVRTFLREFTPPVVTPRVDLAHVLAFIRTIGRLGVVGPERRHYWHLLAWTLARRPRHFSRAVTLAIYGYHFRRVSSLHVA